jgi:hypothetical protein
MRGGVGQLRKHFDCERPSLPCGNPVQQEHPHSGLDFGGHSIGWVEPLQKALTLYLVPTLYVSSFWKWIEPGIEAVFRECPDDFSTPDVYAYLRMNKATLFLCFVGGEFAGFFTAEIVTDPIKERRTLFVWLLHFLGANELDLEDRLDDLARSANCCRVQFKSPRFGWKKRAEVRGYKLKMVTWERVL